MTGKSVNEDPWDPEHLAREGKTVRELEKIHAEQKEKTALLAVQVADMAARRIAYSIATNSGSRIQMRSVLTMAATMLSEFAERPPLIDQHQRQAYDLVVAIAEHEMSES